MSFKNFTKKVFCCAMLAASVLTANAAIDVSRLMIVGGSVWCGYYIDNSIVLSNAENPNQYKATVYISNEGDGFKFLTYAGWGGELCPESNGKGIIHYSGQIRQGEGSAIIHHGGKPDNSVQPATNTNSSDQTNEALPEGTTIVNGQVLPPMKNSIRRGMIIAEGSDSIVPIRPLTGKVKENQQK